jgi:hypothetical protein
VTPQTKEQSAVTLLERCLFVRTSELLNKVTVSAKDASVKVKWVTLDQLDPSYHSVLVRTAMAVIKLSSSNHFVAFTKEALFIFLLDILNGKPQTGFLTSACHRYPMGNSASTHTHTRMKPIPGLMGMGTANFGYGF